VVHEQPQRLERARRRMNVARPAMDDAADDVGERTSGYDGFVAPRRHDVGRGRPGASHAHIQGAVMAEREAALWRVELHGRDAEIEDDAVDGIDAEAGGDLVERTEPALDQRQASGG